MKNLVMAPEPTDSKVTRAILRFLNARVSFPSWMLAISSWALALICLYYLGFVPEGLGEFGAALPFNGYAWTPMLIASSSATMIGLIWPRRVWLLRYGAFVSFLMWVLGGIAFVLSGASALAAVLALPWLLFYAYVYLASFFRDETGI